MPSKSSLVAIAILLLLSQWCRPVQAQEHDIMELYQLAKAKDPVLMRAEAELAGGRADKDIARAALLPKISANGSIRQFWHELLHYQNVQATAANPHPKDPPEIEGTWTGYSYGAGGAMYLVNVPAWRQLDVANAGIEGAQAGVEAARQDLLLRLVDAYIRFLKAKADEKLYRDEVARVGRVLDQSEAFLKAGTGDVISVYEARARVDTAAAELVKNEGILRVAQQDLSIITGVPVDSVRGLEVARAQGPNPADMNWWTEAMLRRNPSVHKAQEELRQAEESTRVASAGHYPTIDGNGGYTVDKGQTFLPNIETKQWYAGIRMNVPIYSGGETAARTRRALADESARRAALHDAQETAVRKLREAYVTLQYSESLVAAYQRKKESAAEQLKAVKKGREIGTRTAIDLLDAEQGFAIGSRDLSSGLYDNLLRLFQLKGAAGLLTESDLGELKGALVETK
jgi:outer membrane protein